MRKNNYLKLELMNSCDLSEIPVIGDKINRKNNNTTIFYFEKLIEFVVKYREQIRIIV